MLIHTLTGFMLVSMRMFGFIVFNPILGRKNVPALARSGIALTFSIVLYSTNPPIIETTFNTIEYAVIFAKEFAVGFLISYVMQLFTSTIVFAGEIIDMQAGMSMSKVYDPSSNISMPMSASIYNTLFIFLFFTTNAHLNLINLLLISGEIVPFGAISISPEIYTYMLDMFSQSMVLALKLAFPIITIELMFEVGVGILMRAIPSINIFAVNIQAKLLIGLIAIFMFFAPAANFIERLILLMTENIETILINLR